MKYADLHLHTIYSDGTYTPKELVRSAKSKGFSCISICDHDCVDAIDPALEYSKKDPIEIIPGVEITVMRRGQELHMLGYFISWKEPWFADTLKRIQGDRITRLDKMLEKLKGFDVQLDKERVLAIAGGKGSVGRLHLARALYEAKAVTSVQMAFDKYIGDFKPCYVEEIGFSPREAIEIILKAKGVPILAHPGKMIDRATIVEFVKYGLCGIETFHPDHNSATRSLHERVAKECGLLLTGGSDCHGYGSGKLLMGSVKVPYEMVERLKERASSI
ncbi:MAG: PHP domain-containing protein [Candidatus Omnitrophota bacterium]